MKYPSEDFVSIEDAGNQKSGEHKKKIDPHPAVLEYLLRMKHGIFQADVMRHHHQDCHAADGIELRNSSLHALSEEPLYLSLYERMPESRKGTDEYSQMLENRFVNPSTGTFDQEIESPTETSGNVPERRRSET